MGFNSAFKGLNLFKNPRERAFKQFKWSRPQCVPKIKLWGILCLTPSHVPEVGFRRFFVWNKTRDWKCQENKKCDSTCRHIASWFGVTGNGRNACNVEHHHLYAWTCVTGVIRLGIITFVGHVTNVLGFRPYNCNCHHLNPRQMLTDGFTVILSAPSPDLGGTALSLSSINLHLTWHVLTVWPIVVNPYKTVVKIAEIKKREISRGKTILMWILWL
jgi:hypothetical protein